MNFWTLCSMHQQQWYWLCGKDSFFLDEKIIALHDFSFEECYQIWMGKTLCSSEKSTLVKHAKDLHLWSNLLNISKFKSQHWRPGSHFNIKTIFPGIGISTIKTVMRPSYSGNTYTGKTSSLYWDRPWLPSSSYSSMSLLPSGDFMRMKEILDEDLTQRDACSPQDGATPLMFAAMMGRLDMVQLLVDKGCNINQQDKVSGWTALMQATYHGLVFHSLRSQQNGCHLADHIFRFIVLCDNCYILIKNFTGVQRV